MRTSARQQGFVLVGTLWILAALTVLVGFFALWTERAVQLAEEQQRNVRGDLDIASTEATLLYLLTTQPITVGGLTLQSEAFALAQADMLERAETDLLGGLFTIGFIGNEIRMDNRPYQGLGATRFSLQDESGLVSLADDNPADLERLLGAAGVPADERLGLVDKFMDYIDIDDGHRINGAEELHYRDQGRPPPTNRLLRTPLEVQRILGWDNWAARWRERWNQWTTVYAYGRPNLNTAPLEALQVYPGIDVDVARQLIELRELMPFENETDVIGLLGFNPGLDVISTNFYPGKFLRLSFWRADSRRMKQYTVELTPFAEQARPWATHYALELPLPSHYAKKINFPETPLLNPALSTDP